MPFSARVLKGGWIVLTPNTTGAQQPTVAPELAAREWVVCTVLHIFSLNLVCATQASHPAAPSWKELLGGCVQHFEEFGAS